MNLSLRDTREEDLLVLYEHQRDPVAIEMAAFTPRDQDEFTTHWTKILADPAISKKTILVEGQIAGYVLGFERSEKTEVGYWIGREYWGRGVATGALSGFLRCVTERPLHAVVAKHNAGSIRVLEKCGFVVVGAVHEPSGTPGPEVEEILLKLSASAERSE